MESWDSVNGRELYDMTTDAGQTRDVAAGFPDTVRLLQERYEKWWADVTRQKDAYVRIQLGGRENPVRLTGHDLHPSTKAMPPWHQRMVRKGDAPSVGEWMVDVKKAGWYEVTLRRWPEESGLPNYAAAAAGGPIPGGIPYPAGRAFQWKKAHLKIAGHLKELPVGSQDEVTTFKLHLPKGPASLQAWFTDENGDKQWTDQQIKQAYGLSIAGLERLRERLVLEGFKVALFGKKREVFKEKLFTGEVEAKLIALRCSDPPQGYNRWTLRLLADRMVSLEYVEHMSHWSVRDILKKTKLSPGKSEVG